MRTPVLQAPYDLRPSRSLDTWELSGWTLKVYGISASGPRPSDALVVIARDLARRTLPQPALAEHRYGVGFVGIHEGRGANFVFVDWWENDNEIHHVNYFALEGETSYTEARGGILCVWDLRVLEFERAAWIGTVLKNPAGPDLDAYLARRLNEDV